LSSGHFAQPYFSTLILFSENDESFANFKRDPDYGKILEGGEEVVGKIALKSIARLKGTDLLLNNLEKFKENDRYGNPILRHYKLTGDISPSTLRYVNSLLEIKNLIGDYQPKKIVEVGGGYGGLAKTLSAVYDFDEYTLIDLPPVIELCKKYLNHFKDIKKKMRYIYCDDIKAIEQIKDVDLFISDSAFAECDQETQTMYTNSIAKKAQFVFVTFNTFHIKGAENEMTTFEDSFKGSTMRTYKSDDKWAVAIKVNQ
jgi:putative sugar O-methyltransferase